MHGIFYNAFKRSFPIRSYLNISVSASYPSLSWLRPERLIENLNHSLGWASLNELNSFLEFKFLDSIFYFTGYGLKTPSNDDENIRNWRVDCLKNDTYIAVDNHVDDDSLCPNLAPNTFCLRNDMKFFELYEPYYCNSVRIVSTGRGQSGRYYLSLSAVDFAGILYDSRGCKVITRCMCYCQYRHLILSISVFILL